jgi:DNA-binding transcriptional ArsR family regulator
MIRYDETEMNTVPLWKQCRILANPVRLNLLACLSRQPRRYVKSLGEELGLAEDVASKNLQLLASGGFLTAERAGRYLYYSLAESNPMGPVVLAELRRQGGDVNPVIRDLTALTHERRVAVVSILSGQTAGVDVLCRQARISGLAAGRHLDKLIRRGWIRMSGDQCELLVPATPLVRELIEAAKKSVTLAQV